MWTASRHRLIKPSELLKALADSIDVIHERVRKKPAVAMVAAYNKAMTALMPVIPGPSRALREVDIMEDGSVWATLDEGCNTTCHSRQWSENAEAKFLSYGFVVERYDSKNQYHGVGDKPVETKRCYMFPFNICLFAISKRCEIILITVTLSCVSNCTSSLYRCYTDHRSALEIKLAKVRIGSGADLKLH